MAMGASSSGSHWIPEDDFLLKKAIESGASLESLAKGAVQFSRRFSVQELQGRWRSILYDPVLSAEASASMSDFERSPSFLQSKCSKLDSARDIKGPSGKRKGGSIRRCYYSMRKRIRNETLDSTDFNILVPDFTDDGSGHEPPAADYMFGNPVSAHFGNQGSNFEVTDHPFLDDGDGGEIGKSEKFSVCDLIEAGDFKVENSDMFGEIVNNDEMPNSECASFHSLECPSPLTQGPGWSTMEGVSASRLADIDYGDDPNAPDSTLNDTTAQLIALSESLMNSENQDDLYMVDEAYMDNLSSLLLNSPNEGETSIADDEHVSFPISEPPQDSGDSHMVVCSKERMPTSALSVKHDFPEFRNGVICCLLNTEDTDIPSNDDVFLPVRLPSSSFPPFPDRKFHNDCYPLLTSSVKDIPTHQKANHGGAFTMKREEINYDHTHPSSQMIGSLVKPKSSSDHATDARGVKLGTPKNDSLTIATRNVNNCFGVSIEGNGINSEPAKNHNNYPTNSHLKTVAHENSVGLDKMAIINKLENDASVLPHYNLALDSDFGCKGVTDQKAEESPSESDYDMPYSSDVEAMILDMDLSPDDHDINSSNEVLKYQYEESKRTIIRLEQAANTYLQMVMEANGSFAVLYSGHSNYFIKKPEVLIGRATEDHRVDIDLGREGFASKISRRQAYLKLDMTTGSFSMKNLGKFSTYVNGKEVAPKETQTLTPGCLIEVKGKAFLFETNKKLIKRHVEERQSDEQKPTMH